MIKFNELRVSPRGKLIIDVQVMEDAYYDNVYIDKIIVDNHTTFTTSGPSSDPMYTYQVPSGNNEKSIKLTLGNADMPTEVAKSLFFVYVITKGTPRADTPCGMDNVITLGITYYEQAILRNFMGYIKELGNTCVIPKGFIDYFLRYKAFQLAIATGDYKQAIVFWENFFKKKSIYIGHSNCGCHGAS